MAIRQTRKTPPNWRGTAINRAALFCGAALPFLLCTTASLAAQDTPLPPIQKVYGPTPQESSPPSWPEVKKAPDGSPNVLLIMTDDVGFGASSTFGGTISTPAFDALAAGGITYNGFNTAAICSPTRASLLTGRNPQAVGMGYTTNWATGYDGYNSAIPKSAGTVAQILKDNGYNTAMFGKGHITPEWEMSMAGPFDRWPTGLGFEYFYGFLGADTSMFQPSLVENTQYISPPATDPDYHLEKDLADHAIHWLAERHAVAPDKPFFIYYATGAAHAPNQAPKEWLEKFRGKFDEGWDVLRARTVGGEKAAGVIPRDTADAPRPANLPQWDSLSSYQKRVYARFMEAYAASLAYADSQIGRVIQQLRDDGELDNTLIIYIQGDNGASAEGSFDGKLFEQSPLSGIKEDFNYTLSHMGDIGTAAAYNLMPGGWGWAMNAPFPWAKRYASHFGGTRNAMVMSWPGHIRHDGQIRSQYHHVSDIMPTILDVAGIKAPQMLDGVAQQPITGISMRYTFTAPKAPSHRTTQVYGMAQNLSIYQNGWVAATKPMATPWEKTPPAPVAVNDRVWELYHVTDDFSESADLAQKDPQKLAQMKDLFWAEAARANILPIHASEGHQQGRPDPNSGRSTFTYSGPMTHIPETAAPPVAGRSFTMTARVEVPEGGAVGVIAAQGGRYAGYSLFFHDGRPTFTYNMTPAHITRLQAQTPVAAGPHIITADFSLDGDQPGGSAHIHLSVDGKEVVKGTVDHSFPLVISHTEGLDIGEDTISAVDDSYSVETSRFNGTLNTLTVTAK